MQFFKQNAEVIEFTSMTSASDPMRALDEINLHENTGAL